MSLYLAVSFRFGLKIIGDEGGEIERIESEFFKGAEKISYEMANKLIDEAVNEESSGGLLLEADSRSNRTKGRIKKSINSIGSNRSIKNAGGLASRKDVGMSLNVPTGAAGRKSTNPTRHMSKMVPPVHGTLKNKKN